jgi:hypothetical protein
MPTGRRIRTRAPTTGKFVGKYAHRVVKGGVGHNLPQQAPAAFAQAIMDVDRY